MLQYFGANHTTNPEDPQFAEIFEHLKRTKPEIVYVEGMENSNKRKEQVREQMQKITIEEAMRHGENFYTLKCAVDAGIDFESPEPTDADEILYLVGKGFSKQDIFNFYLYRVIHQYQRHHTSRTVDDAKKYLLPHIEALQRDSGWDANEIDVFERHFFAELDVNDDARYGAQVDPIPWDDTPQTSINDISRTSSHFRDKHIFERIEEALKTHDRVFVVYGSAHAVKQELALKMLMKEMK